MTAANVMAPEKTWSPAYRGTVPPRAASAPEDGSAGVPAGLRFSRAPGLRLILRSKTGPKQD